MTKITNKGPTPVSVFCGGISMAIAGGDHIDSENFTAKEIAFYQQFPAQYGVESDGAVGDEAVTTAMVDFHNSLRPIAERLGVDRLGFVDAVMGELDDGEKARELLREIAALFGTEEVDELNVKSAVERLIQDAATRPAETTNDEEFNSPLNNPTEKPTNLASAVKLLDDANDDHWTQTGKPRVSALADILGGDVTAAQYDQLPEGDKRERVK